MSNYDIKRKIDELEDNSDEPIREILGKTPNWLIRSGSTLLLLFFIIFIIILAILEYPEKITGDISITSYNAPKPIIALTEGKLKDLFVENDQYLEEGQIIGYIESIGNHDDVLILSKIIDSVKLYIINTPYEEIKTLKFSTKYELGEIQEDYYKFLELYQDFEDHLSSGFYSQKLKILNKEYNKIKNANEQLTIQSNIYVKELEIAEKELEMNKVLRDRNVISPSEYRKSESTYNQSSLNLPQIRHDIENNEKLLSQKQSEIFEIENNINKRKQLFISEINTFQSQINNWKKRYIIIAQIDGRLTFSSFIHKGQQLTLNENIGYLSPQNSEYYGELMLPEFNMGKVYVGQRVILKLEAYPYAEYGIIDGKLDYISPINSHGLFLAKISFPNGLKTSYNKQIEYRVGLLAKGEVITKELTLLERFYYNIVKSIKN